MIKRLLNNIGYFEIIPNLYQNEKKRTINYYPNDKVIIGKKEYTEKEFEKLLIQEENNVWGIWSDESIKNLT